MKLAEGENKVAKFHAACFIKVTTNVTLPRTVETSKWTGMLVRLTEVN